MRWDYPPLDINPVFSGLGEFIIIIIIIIINIIIILLLYYYYYYYYFIIIIIIIIIGPQPRPEGSYKIGYVRPSVRPSVCLYVLRIGSSVFFWNLAWC